MKTALIALLVIAYALTVVTPAAADSTNIEMTVEEMTGERINSHLPQPKPAQSCKLHETCITQSHANKPICWVDAAGKIKCTKPAFEIDQDLTQCTLSTTGNQILCVDKCGGRSAPGTACTFE